MDADAGRGGPCENDRVNRLTRTVGTPTVTIEAFDHPAGVEHLDPEHEIGSVYSVNFVECGSFGLRVGDATWNLTPQLLFVGRPGLVFSCFHHDACPTDRCWSLSFSEAAIESLWVEGARPSPSPVIPLSNRQAYLQYRLGECSGGDGADLEALAGALYFTLSPTTPPTRPPFRRDRLAWYARRISRARDLIHAQYETPLSLSVLAADAGMSPFHFARVFRELEGTPPHRYLRDVRLRHAARRLRDGAGVTDTCFAVGFGSLSHFITTFRQRYGTRPSDVGRGKGRLGDIAT